MVCISEWTHALSTTYGFMILLVKLTAGHLWNQLVRRNSLGRHERRDQRWKLLTQNVLQAANYHQVEALWSALRSLQLGRSLFVGGSLISLFVCARSGVGRCWPAGRALLNLITQFRSWLSAGAGSFVRSFNPTPLDGPLVQNANARVYADGNKPNSIIPRPVSRNAIRVKCAQARERLCLCLLKNSRRRRRMCQ
jgi:hypothetical protein